MSYKKYLCTLSLAIMLCGCNVNQDNIQKSSEKIQNTYYELSDFQTDIKFLCDSGQSILEYDCEFEYNKEYGQTLTIKKPDSLSGIVINSTGTSQDNITLNFKDTVLDFNTSAQFGTSPADFMPNLISVLTNGEPDEIWEETQGNQKLLVARYETSTDDKPVTVQVWLYKTSLLPMYAEAYTDGERVLQAFFNKTN